jgi:hypothetical protein
MNTKNQSIKASDVNKADGQVIPESEVDPSKSPKGKVGAEKASTHEAGVEKAKAIHNKSKATKTEEAPKDENAEVDLLIDELKAQVDVSGTDHITVKQLLRNLISQIRQMGTTNKSSHLRRFTDQMTADMLSHGVGEAPLHQSLANDQSRRDDAINRRDTTTGRKVGSDIDREKVPGRQSAAGIADTPGAAKASEEGIEPQANVSDKDNAGVEKDGFNDHGVDKNGEDNRKEKI